VRRENVRDRDQVRSKHGLGDLELLNSRWHHSKGERSLGACTACGADIAPYDRAVFLHGEVYHARCAL
jgi:hypothetical protein